MNEELNNNVAIALTDDLITYVNKPRQKGGGSISKWLQLNCEVDIFGRIYFKKNINEW